MRNQEFNSEIREDQEKREIRSWLDSISKDIGISVRAAHC